MKNTLTLAAAVVLLSTASAFAQIAPNRPVPPGSRFRPQNPVQPREGGAQAAVNDGLFAAAAADGGLTELTLSRLGAERATDPELKRLSERMIDEHTRMNEELKTLAAQKGMALPRTTDFRAQFCAQSLAGLSGAEFDRCYAKAQLVVHMDSIALFEAEAKRGMDRDMAALASKALPRIKEHYKMIKPIAKKYMSEEESESERPATSTRIQGR